MAMYVAKTKYYGYICTYICNVQRLILANKATKFLPLRYFIVKISVNLCTQEDKKILL